MSCELLSQALIGSRLSSHDRILQLQTRLSNTFGNSRHLLLQSSSTLELLSLPPDSLSITLSDLISLYHQVGQRRLGCATTNTVLLPTHDLPLLLFGYGRALYMIDPHHNLVLGHWVLIPSAGGGTRNYLTCLCEVGFLGDGDSFCIALGTSAGDVGIAVVRVSEGSGEDFDDDAPSQRQIPTELVRTGLGSICSLTACGSMVLFGTRTGSFGICSCGVDIPQGGAEMLIRLQQCEVRFGGGPDAEPQAAVSSLGGPVLILAAEALKTPSRSSARTAVVGIAEEDAFCVIRVAVPDGGVAFVIQFRTRGSLVVIRALIPVNDVMVPALRDAVGQGRRMSDLLNSEAATATDGLMVGPQTRDIGRLPTSLEGWVLESVFGFGMVPDEKRFGFLFRCPGDGKVVVAEASVRDLCWSPLSLEVDIATVSRRRRSFVAHEFEQALPAERLSTPWRLDPDIGESVFRMYMLMNFDGLRPDQLIVFARAVESPHVPMNDRVLFVVLTNSGLLMRFMLRSSRECLLKRFRAYARNLDLASPTMVYGMRELCSQAGLLQPEGSTDVEEGEMDVDGSQQGSSESLLHDVLGALWTSGYSRYVAQYVSRRRSGDRAVASPFLCVDHTPVFYWVQRCVEEKTRLDVEAAESLLRRDSQAQHNPGLDALVRSEVARLRRDHRLLRDLLQIIDALVDRVPTESSWPPRCNALARNAKSLIEFLKFACWLVDSGFNRFFDPTRVSRPAGPPLSFTEIAFVSEDMSSAQSETRRVPHPVDVLWRSLATSSMDARYPPQSPKQILDCFQAPASGENIAVLYRKKYAAVFFYLLEYVIGAEEEIQDDDAPRIPVQRGESYLRHFPSTFGIRDHWESFVYGLWALSRLGSGEDDRNKIKHGDIRRLATVKSADVPSLLCDVVRALLLRQTGRSNLTARLLLNSMGSLGSEVLEMMVHVRGRDYRSAFRSQDCASGEMKRKLLFVFLEHLAELDALPMFFQYSLDAVTESLFVSYLKTQDHWDVLRRFYVSRSRYYEAMKVAEMMGDEDASSRLRTVIPSLVLNLGRKADSKMETGETPSNGPFDEPHDVRRRLVAAVSRVEGLMRYPPRSIPNRSWHRSCFGGSGDYRLWGLRDSARKRSRVSLERDPSTSPEPTVNEEPRSKKRRLNVDDRDEAMDVDEDRSSPDVDSPYDDEEPPLQTSIRLGRFPAPPIRGPAGTMDEPISIDSSSDEESLTQPAGGSSIGRDEFRDSPTQQPREFADEDDDYEMGDDSYRPFGHGYDPTGGSW